MANQIGSRAKTPVQITGSQYSFPITVNPATGAQGAQFGAADLLAALGAIQAQAVGIPLQEVLVALAIDANNNLIANVTWQTYP